jgi:hypothetical protein
MSLVGQSRRFEPGSRISGLAPTPDISVVHKWLGPRRMIATRRGGSPRISFEVAGAFAEIVCRQLIQINAAIVSTSQI